MWKSTAAPPLGVGGTLNGITPDKNESILAQQTTKGHKVFPCGLLQSRRVLSEFDNNLNRIGKCHWGSNFHLGESLTNQDPQELPNVRLNHYFHSKGRFNKVTTTFTATGKTAFIEPARQTHSNQPPVFRCEPSESALLQHTGRHTFRTHYPLPLQRLRQLTRFFARKGQCSFQIHNIKGFFEKRTCTNVHKHVRYCLKIIL